VLGYLWNDFRNGTYKGEQRLIPHPQPQHMEYGGKYSLGRTARGGRVQLHRRR